MNWTLLVIIGSQLLFTTSDFLARSNMPKYGFTLSAFFTPWFAAYFAVRIIATFGQLYVFTTTELGKTLALFGAVAIILANVLGLLFLKEVLNFWTYFAVSLTIVSFLVLAFS